jgi:tryptophanyl-tRNA synthetase
MAIGLDPDVCTLFVQSHVAEHTSLTWLLECTVSFGELRRMTQFKDKAGSTEESVSAALFDYPVLQVADILIYDADLVPVGEDQRQHIELARDVAQRFNRRYGDTFVVPAPDIKTSGARIMSLEDPTKKMSKSAGSAGSYIALTDTDSEITKKIKRAVTDSGSEVKAAPDKPALTNLLGIYSLLSNESLPEIEDRYAGKGYGAFKTDLATILVDAIRPIREKLLDYEANPDYAMSVLAEGANRARDIAEPKMAITRERMGLTGHVV